MILNGSQRGGGQNLATHLLKDENDHIELYSLRGFLSSDLHGAFKEAHAISKGTKCEQYLFSLSLNPPQHETVSTQHFEEAIDKVEGKLGLSNQPRAIVFHEKDGRRHCHVVWSRIDAATMTAKQMSHTHYKLRDISRELFLEHGWTIPKGLMNSVERDPKNFTLAEWQQAKRAMKDPREIKAAIQESWSISDGKTAFAHALKERGYILAKGDKRGFVAVDLKGEVYAIAKATGRKTKEINAKLGGKEALATLPTVSQAKAHIVADLSPTLQRLTKEQEAKQTALYQDHSYKKQLLKSEQQDARTSLSHAQQTRWLHESQARQDRYRTGLSGLWDRISGKHKTITKQNETEALDALRRDRAEKDALITQHLDKWQQLQAGYIDKLTAVSKDHQTLARDAGTLDQIKAEADKTTLRYLHRQQQEREQDHSHHHDDQHARKPHAHHSRDGPTPGL